MEQKIYGFIDNLIWIGNDKFSLLLREYSQLGVNVLKSSPKISDLIKNSFFSLTLGQKVREQDKSTFLQNSGVFGTR